MSLREQLDALAEHVATEARISKTFQESIDALKALTAYFAAVNKAKDGEPPEDDSPDFAKFSSAIHGAEEPADVPSPTRRRRVTGHPNPEH